jgi:hypothetical protein
LIQQQNRRFEHQRLGFRDTLLLAAGEARGKLALVAADHAKTLGLVAAANRAISSPGAMA